MSKKPPSTKEELAFLGRGIVRTFVRDVIVVTCGAIIGAALALMVLSVMGYPATAGLKLGALGGAFLGLVFRSVFSPLFDYDGRPPKDDDKSQ